MYPPMHPPLSTPIQDALPLTEVESAFDTSAESIGDSDCRIQRVSALKGLMYLWHIFIQEFVKEGEGDYH